MPKDLNTRVPAGQKMPRPWFRANNTAGPLMGIYKLDSDWDRPLFEGERKLGNFVLPPFQRPPVWTRAQQVRFIESIWNGLPLGAYIVNRVLAPLGNKYDNLLLDGQQRITAILDYTDSKFEVFGHLWSDLTKQDHSQFGMTPMSYLETQLSDMATILDVYDRLAYGGTPHDPKAEAIEHVSFREGDELVVRARFKSFSDEFAEPHIWLWPVQPKDVISHKPKGAPDVGYLPGSVEQKTRRMDDDYEGFAPGLPRRVEDI